MQPENRRILRLPEVQARSGLSRATIYREAQAGRFPKPVKITERASGWFEDEINSYLETRAAKRGDAFQAPQQPA